MKQTLQRFSLIYFFVLSYLVVSCQQEKKLDNNFPIEILDPSLKLELVLEHPDIMTPIGIAIDDKDALFILESHTHSPLSDYKGPKYDRIKKGIDTNGDHLPDKWSIYADSLEDGMNLHFEQNHGLYATTKDAVYVFQDKNNDGISDEKRLLLSLYEPKNTYDHSALLGITIANDWLYVSRGNTGGNLWKIRGTDGKEISGYGDGGSVMRCKLDGSDVEHVATGFWNPFDMKFLKNGRLFLTDNDPDSRGPNRLIEVVPGGDYGYQSIYGNSGNHPYLAWNGELPGTLGYAAPLGEAPCALIDASLTNFGFSESVLVNVWEENNIVKIDLKQQGSTFTGTPEVLVQGDSLFHPVAFATNSYGDLFISDWVVRQYPNHGQGRIWRLSKKDGNISPTPAITTNRFKPHKISKSDFEAILTSGDDFDKSIARFYAGKQIESDDLTNFLKSENPEVRLQTLLICISSGAKIKKTQLASLITDKETDISRMALVYTGKYRRQELKESMEDALIVGEIKAELFEVFLSTIRQLQPEFVSQFGVLKNTKKLPFNLPENYISSILENNNTNEEIRAIALPYLENKDKKVDLLLTTLKSAKTDRLKGAVIKALSGIRSKEIETLFLDIAKDQSNVGAVRAQAILQLRNHSGEYCQQIKNLVIDNSAEVQYARVKYLSKCMSDQELIAQVNEEFKDKTQPAAAASVWKFINGQFQKPDNLQGWNASVNEEGNPLVGRFIFETNLCATCHKVNSWGGNFGPDLSNIGNSKSQQQLISSILEPSKEIAPEWQGWYVVDKEGEKHQGRQIDVHLNNVELMNTDGSFTTYPKPKSYGVAEKSLMPENLQDLMTGQEFNDLIAYLVSLK